MSQVSPSRKIGQRTTRREIDKDRKKKQPNKKDNMNSFDLDPLVCTELDLKVIGLAVSWSENQVHYISLAPSKGK